MYEINILEKYFFQICSMLYKVLKQNLSLICKLQLSRELYKPFISCSYIELHCSKRRERGTGKSRRRARRSGSPPGSVRNSVKDQGKFHSAVSHDDTTEGALHWFQDESGKVQCLFLNIWIFFSFYQMFSQMT